MNASRHTLHGFQLALGRPHPAVFARTYGNRDTSRHSIRLLIHDLANLLPLLWSASTRTRYGTVLDAVGRVAFVSGLILAAAFPPWRVTYTFAPHSKEALYQCREYVGPGPIVGGRNAVNARATSPSGEYRLVSKAPWASFPSRIHCDGYTGKYVGISTGRWLLHFVAILAGFGLWRKASSWLSGARRATTPNRVVQKA